MTTSVRSSNYRQPEATFDPLTRMMSLRLLFLVIVTVAAAGCDRKPEDNGPRNGATVAPIAPLSGVGSPATPALADGLPAAWRLPLGWHWVTAAKAGFTAAYPALPTIDSPTPGAERLLVRTSRAEYAVGRARDEGEAERYRREVKAAGWRVVGDRALDGGVRAIDATHDKLATHTRLVPVAGRMFIVTFTSALGDDADAATFLDSFRPTGAMESRAVRFAPGGFTVTTPARVSEWEEHSAEPPLRGLTGLVDGTQFSAAFTDVGQAALSDGPQAFLARGLAASLAEVGGATLERDDASFHGHPSIRIEHRGQDGVHVSRRVLMAGTRFYDLAVYAPSGETPLWADAFVNSLVLDR